MNRTRVLLLSVAIVALVVGIALTTAWAYSVRQLQDLQDQTVYASPEAGMRELVVSHYSGVDKVDIAHADKEIFDDLWFVEAHVWAASRSDGKGFVDRDYDNPGWFFLRVQDGWVFVPEAKYPHIIAFGQQLFGLSG